MPKFRKKPVVVEAHQHKADDTKATAEWIEKVSGKSWCEVLLFDVQGRAVIKTLEGTMIGDDGDYIIRGVNGEFYPCKPDIFEKTYEPVADESTVYGNDCRDGECE